MKPREGIDLATARHEQLAIVQDAYPEFIPFLEDVMADLGFGTTDVQKDIGSYMAYGPQYLMVEAQRGQAKSTIAAAFAVWSLLQNPKERVLILSAGGTMAQEISTLIVRIIMTMDVLECLRPDKMAGDRTSTEGFDIHHSLKGVDKSPSVACVGIDSNLQGKRAGLLIADDVESGKNSATAVQRAKLLHITKDFTSINSTGRILWLGTPQTMESIYNSLSARGVTIRIWPGRYPTPEQVERYGGNLAPFVTQRLARDPSLGTGGGILGDQGQPLDPVLLDEAALQKKEMDQGTAYFQLQHMLNTAMMDALRFPLKPERLVVVSPGGERYPLTVVRGMDPSKLRDFSVNDFPFRMMAPHELSHETSTFQSKWAYIDPAGGGANADETAYAIGGYLNGNVHLVSVGGLPGGYDLTVLEELAKRIAKHRPDGVTIEKNMGYGAFAAVFTPILRRMLVCQILEDLVTGQKEARIINTLEPIMGRGALIVSEAVVQEDIETTERYTASLRSSYSFFFQLAKITRVRDSLVHDDRVDAVEGLCRHFTAAIAVDQEKQVAAARARAHAEMIKDPCGHNRCIPAPGHYGSGRPNILANRLGNNHRRR